MSIFHFSDFSVSDDRCGQKVCSDAVLFGAWCSSKARRAPGSVLDIGCGSGVLALLMAREFPDALITGVEIEPGAAADARVNFAASPWSDRLELIVGSFEEVLSPPDRWDAIICNPPFFSGGLCAPQAQRAGARHQDSLNFKSLCTYAAASLSPDGVLWVLIPAEGDSELLFQAELAGLTASRHCLVYTSPRKAARRAMWEFRLRKANAVSARPVVEERIDIRDSSGAYTPQYLYLVEKLYHHLS